MLTAIFARDENGIIGIDNDIPWSIEEDFLYFKKKTYNSNVIMGRKTWESLPKRPLPKRNNFILSSQDSGEWSKGATIIKSLEELPNEGYIIGGSQIYKETLPLCDTVLETIINTSIDCNDNNQVSYAPIINENNFQTIYESQPIEVMDRKTGKSVSIVFKEWERIKTY